jgi:predicted RecB family nuclease
MEQGQEIGRLARQLYANGRLVQKSDGTDPAEITRSLCANGNTKTLFEAAVQAGPFVAKADILTREGSGWHVLEVKSSLSDTKKMPDYIDDLAYTVMVLRRVGLQVPKASLVLLSRNYRFGEPTEKLFDTLDKTNEVNGRVAEFDAEADDVARVLFDETQPVPKLVSACRACGSYKGECLGSGVDHTVLEIPGLHYTKLKRLSQDGIVDVCQLPNDLKLNDRQQRAVSAMMSGKTAVEPGLRAALDKLQWPCHYLDFETAATVLPLYEGHGCHRQTLTQFSIHHRDSIQAEPTHSEYLADPARDCERELAETLIKSLGDSGSILVYSNFEEKRIKALRDQFPELAQRLQRILDRLEDFEKLIQENVYHPDFYGSFSIKRVLPALVPELSYAGLDIRDGDTAISRFARMAKGEIVGEAARETQHQLLEYCKMDTRAMVRLHETLVQLAAG